MNETLKVLLLSAAGGFVMLVVNFGSEWLVRKYIRRKWYPTELENKLGAGFDAMAKHLGNARSVYGEQQSNGKWTIFVRCVKCQRPNRLTRGVLSAKCGACGTLFHEVTVDKSAVPAQMAH